jgi:hypothetical protein
MAKITVITAILLIALSSIAAAETWTNVSLVDANCAAKVKADPDKHTTQCALHCADSGMGILTSDGSFLKFDAAGNQKAIAALKATKKTDHLRATVTGDRNGDNIKVQSLKLD